MKQFGSEKTQDREPVMIMQIKNTNTEMRLKYDAFFARSTKADLYFIEMIYTKRFL